METKSRPLALLQRTMDNIWATSFELHFAYTKTLPGGRVNLMPLQTWRPQTGCNQKFDGADSQLSTANQPEEFLWVDHTHLQIPSSPCLYNLFPESLQGVQILLNIANWTPWQHPASPQPSYVSSAPLHMDSWVQVGSVTKLHCDRDWKGLWSFSPIYWTMRNTAPKWAT